MNRALAFLHLAGLLKNFKSMNSNLRWKKRNMISAHNNLLYTMPEKGKEQSLYNKVFGSKWPAISTGYMVSLMVLITHIY